MSGCCSRRSRKKSTSCSSAWRSPARSCAQIVWYCHALLSASRGLDSRVSRPKRKCRPRAGSQNGSPSMSKMTSPGEGRGSCSNPHPGSMGNACQSRAPVVGREVGVAQGAALADAEQDVHCLGCDSLDGGDGLRVEAELQHVGGLLGARELGVEGFVAPLP